jgi:hypothetical protein
MQKRSWWIAAWTMALTLVLASGTLADVSGTYEFQGKGELRKLTITEMKGINSVQFNLNVQSGNFTGAMFGLADLKGNVATYKSKDCQLTITFAGNKAVISDADVKCKDYLKPGILLDGTYIKK